jgi:hypothetical protein
MCPSLPEDGRDHDDAERSEAPDGASGQVSETSAMTPGAGDGDTPGTDDGVPPAEESDAEPGGGPTKSYGD